jgi:hypothetical protein
MLILVALPVTLRLEERLEPLDNTMKLISVGSARSVWLFDINDLNPRGKDVNSDLIDWLKDAYFFDKAPTSPNDLDPEKKSLIFERGRFQIKEEIYISVDLEIYNDGFVANSRSSTRDTDEFMEDVLSLAAKEFSLSYDPAMIRTKMHTSELTVRLDSPLFNMHPKLVDFANTISTMSGLAVPPFECTTLGFSTDLAVSHLKPSSFILDRKIGAPFSENRYYSKAPVHTDQHQELLAELEHILSTR